MIQGKKGCRAQLKLHQPWSSRAQGVRVWSWGTWRPVGTPRAGTGKLLVSGARSDRWQVMEEREHLRWPLWPQTRAKKSKCDGLGSFSLPSRLCSPGPLPLPCQKSLFAVCLLQTGLSPLCPGWILSARSQDMPVSNHTNNQLAGSNKGTWTGLGAREPISSWVWAFAIL